MTQSQKPCGYHVLSAVMSSVLNNYLIHDIHKSDI